MTRVAALALLLSGCPTPVCPVQATRCAGDVVELCGSDGQWQVALDCAEVERTSGGEWSCGETREDGEEINTCTRAAPETP